MSLNDLDEMRSERPPSPFFDAADSGVFQAWSEAQGTLRRHWWLPVAGVAIWTTLSASAALLLTA